MQEVALLPLPEVRVAVRVIGVAGEALSGAIVELVARGAGHVSEFVAADAKGIATFADAPPGPLQFTAHAPSHAPGSVRVAEEGRLSITITLARAP